MPKLSIIIPVRNDLDNFKITISNLKFHNDIEVLVVDGNSNDGLQEYISEKSLNKRIIYISQKSRGIYQGFNEGLFAARGEFIVFLCCGDKYHSAEALNLINKTDANIVAASCLVEEKDKNILYLRSKIKKISFSNMSILHGSLIVKRQEYIKINGFNENFRVSADVLAIHQIMRSSNIHYSDVKVVDMIPYGFSDNLYMQKIYEHSKILLKNKLYFQAFIYIPKRLIKDFIILRIWKMIKK